MYAVQYVSDEELPPDQEWVMLRIGRSMRLFIKESAVCPRVIEEAWAGYRRLVAEPAMPAQRPPSKVVALRV